ncbi:MAG: DNA double-strand break repair nuclease NurA [Candidatus Bathyarchaeia archaeon]
MIEQYTITTTPKYNFPQKPTETTLPQRLLELSIHSLKHIQSKQIQLNPQATPQDGKIDTQLQVPNLNLKPTIMQIKPKTQETLVAAIDTSSIKIGETKTGILIAIRGATIWKQNKRYRYIRLGPFIFHITEENKTEVYDALQSAYLGQQRIQNHQYAPNMVQMPTRLAALLERWLQLATAKTMTNSLILLDGSLTAGTPDTPASVMREILESARKTGNAVLAFSKMTTMRLNGNLITDVLPNVTPPFLLELSGLRAKPPLISLGDIYVARLSNGNCAFRLDIDRELPSQEKVEAVERLVGNDLLVQGYPETLRLAHILCTFTANEVIAMQHFITRRYGLKIINRPDMHKLLFGPFGKGEAGA